MNEIVKSLAFLQYGGSDLLNLLIILKAWLTSRAIGQQFRRQASGNQVFTLQNHALQSNLILKGIAIDQLSRGINFRPSARPSILRIVRTQPSNWIVNFESESPRINLGVTIIASGNLTMLD